MQLHCRDRGVQLVVVELLCRCGMAHSCHRITQTCVSHAFSMSADAFYAAVNGYGPCIVWARTKGGAVVGGYNPLGFDG
jgi:hypothetical protein